jgi:hypothetical protein
MEAIPLSETSAAACAKALTFTWISRFGVPETISSDRGGRNLHPIFGSNFAKCLTFRTSKQQLITLSRTAQSKDCTAASRTRFAHAPPPRHVPRSYLLCSSDSEHSREKTLVFFPAEAVFGAQIVFPNEFLQNDELSVDTIVKKFAKPCMFLLLLCLGTILAPSCPASYQPSCSPPPSSESVKPAWFHHFSRSTTAPTQFCAAAPLLHHQSRVAGRGGCRQPP